MRGFTAALAAIVCVSAAPEPAAGPDLKALLDKAPAARLSQYRLFIDGKPDASLTPFAPATPLFSDYAEKYRFVWLPPGTKVRYRAQGALDFPLGATLVKTFAYPADLRRPAENVRWIETRLLIRKKSGWIAQAYLWNAERTEAVLKRAGARVDVSFVDTHGARRQVDYAIPNANQCKECHKLGRTLVPLGPKARNLNVDFAYPSGAENQLAHWSRLGLMEGAPSPAAAPRTVRWDDPQEPLEARARAYLDANCAHCHNARGSASNSGLFLELEQQKATALGVGKRPAAAGRGTGGFEVAIAPGDPDRSILVHRMASTEPGVMMPELSRSLTHEEGLALIRAYVARLK